MTKLDATTDLVVGQWRDSPRLLSAIQAPLEAITADVLPALDRVALMHEVEEAEGIWLDYLGRRVGLSRPATTDPSQDDRFGFDRAGVGFDQGPFRGDGANDAIYPLVDTLFRRLVKSRAILVLGDGTFATFVRAARQIDPGARVRDLRNMTIRVVTGMRALFELADAAGALPRSAAVRVIYADTGRFGFDRTGVGFDQGPFTPVES